MIGREQIRAFVATPKGKLIVACSCLALCWIFLLLYFFGDSITAFGNPKSLAKAKAELAKAKDEYDKVRVTYEKLQAEKKRYREILASAWSGGGEDRVKTLLHNSITAAASRLEFRLDRISSVKIDRLNGELYYAEVDISAAGKLDEIVTLIAALEDIRPVNLPSPCGFAAPFIAALGHSQPRPTWGQLVLRPDNRPRPQVSAGVDSINLANQALTVERTRVTMSGTLRVICADESASRTRGADPRNRGK